MLPSSQTAGTKVHFNRYIFQLSMRLQVISFLRAFLHRIGLQDFLVTSALNRLSLIMSPLKHMLMLCRLLNLTKGGYFTLAELLHVLPPPRAMLPWLQGSSKLLRLPSHKIYILKAIILFKSTQTQDPLEGVPCRLVSDNAPTHCSPSLS